MKSKSVFFSLVICFVMLIGLRVFSQSITLTFNASGAATTVNSIFAKNLTSCDTATFQGNIIVLQNTTGLNNYTFKEGKSYPNPFIGKTNIEYVAKHIEMVTISVFNSLGELVLSDNKELNAGMNSIAFSPYIEGIYHMVIFSADMSTSYKLICLHANSSVNNLDFNIISEENYNSDNSSREINFLNYTPGDTMEFICRNQNYSTVIVDAPPAFDTTYSVVFVACNDYDNNNYKIVKIGTKTWMAENLKTTHYRNGDPIPNVTDSTWCNINTGAYVNYGNNANIVSLNGRLYNWYAVDDSRKICPLGWHPATDSEWTSLENLVGGLNVAGGKLKAVCASWVYPNTGGTNEKGFSALPGGYRNATGNFLFSGVGGYWWTATAVLGGALMRDMFFNRDEVQRYMTYYKTQGCSVRCVKD